MRADVLTATVEVLIDRGFAALTVEEIAERSGVHRTTIHRRWPTRSALVAEALLDISASDVPVPNTGRLRGDLTAFARGVRDAISTPQARSLVAALWQTNGDPEIASVGSRFWEARFAATEVIVRRAIDRGEIPKLIDPRFVIEALGGPIWFRVFVVGDAADDRFLQRVVDVVVGGLKARRR